jgi:iron complex outermembrane recepter protein
MSFRFVLLSFGLAAAHTLAGQAITRDSTLKEVIVHAYSADRASVEVPASVARLDTSALHRFSNSSLVPAVNLIPGVRMEERSPGSYRFSIRGSTIRSPFGVRNVKIYWNGLPLTDAGGNTYLNIIDANQLGSIEVIKGPGGSLYGAGTGGVVLMETPPITIDHASVSSSAGSFGLFRYNLSAQIHQEKINARVSFGSTKSDGYRKQSALDRKALNVELQSPLTQRSSITIALLHGDLFYETPGGLNIAQFEEDPRQARPSAVTPAGPSAGAEEQKAAVENETSLLALRHELDWNENWNTTTTAYSGYTGFTNPAIRNYESRDEWNYGVRSVTRVSSQARATRNITSFGAEFQFTEADIKISGNDAGARVGAGTTDNLTSQLFIAFIQHDLMIKESVNITIGLSGNFSSVGFARIAGGPAFEEFRSFKPVALPRVAVLKKINGNVSVYGTYSYGFSPPTIAELYPSRQVFDKDLDPENGSNVEAGVKGSVWRKKIYFEVIGYSFGLRNTIVLRRDASLPGEPEYFVNAGKTAQRGIEALLSWKYVATQFEMKIGAAYSYNHYRFKNYFQGETNLSGKQLTGSPASFANTTFDFMFFKRWYVNLTGNYVDRIPLDDANSVFSKSYRLLSARAGHLLGLRSGHKLEFFAGVENATNETYSLGHDLNAAGGRYYNAAPGRSYYAGVKVDLFPKL